MIPVINKIIVLAKLKFKSVTGIYISKETS